MNYEKPVVVDFDLREKAEGQNNCRAGTSASQRCIAGSGVGSGPAGNCQNGSSAMGRCRYGASAGNGCSGGSLPR